MSADGQLTVQHLLIECMSKIRDGHIKRMEAFHSCVKMEKLRNKANLEVLLNVKHKFEQASLMLREQTILFENASRGIEHVRWRKLNPLIKPKTITKSHFTRDTLISRNVHTSSSSKNLNDKQISAIEAGVSGLRSLTAWDGSEYKLVLLRSLVSTLSVKLVFSILEYNRNRNVALKAFVSSFIRVTQRNLLFLCFQSILFDSLACRYSEIRSEVIATQYYHHRYLKPAMTQFLERLSRTLPRNKVDCYNYFRKNVLKSTFALLTANVANHKNKRRLAVWSNYCFHRGFLLKALNSWIGVFISRHRLKISFKTRLLKEGKLS